MLSAADQIRLLNELVENTPELTPFETRTGGELEFDQLITMQINVGKMCNQTCKHCHVDAGPTRKEIMTRETMEMCLRALDRHKFKIVDLTGGAPEMNPHFRWLVEQCKARGLHVMSRCNLTIIEANPKYHDLPEFYARHAVEVVSSLPSFDAHTTDRQRGGGVFEKSISALKKLNAVGYGVDPKLRLNLVYNPNGAFLPGDQAELESEFKERLKREHGVVFHNLFTITNMPIARFLEYLIASKNLVPYMRKLHQQFNSQALKALMCRSMISVSWDGHLYDCDFNQMLDLKTSPTVHISKFEPTILSDRKVVTGPHCFGCTAGAGSSCGGAVI